MLSTWPGAQQMVWGEVRGRYTHVNRCGGATVESKSTSASARGGEQSRMGQVHKIQSHKLSVKKVVIERTCTPFRQQLDLVAEGPDAVSQFHKCQKDTLRRDKTCCEIGTCNAMEVKHLKDMV